MKKVTWMISWTAVLCALLFVVSCHKDDEDRQREARDYAGWRDSPNHFDARAYLWAEFSVASDTLKAREVYNGDFSTWQTLSWDDRYPHLPAPFTHDVMTTDQQQYYEMIGKYFGQFGFGWQDTYNSGRGWGRDSSGVWVRPPYPDTQRGSADWTHPASGLITDNPATVAFDGHSVMFYHYRDLWNR